MLEFNVADVKKEVISGFFLYTLSMKTLGQFDMRRLSTLGREGCFTSRGFVTGVGAHGQTSGVVIKPLSEINTNREKINTLYLGVNTKASLIEKLSKTCQSNYQKYIDTPIPVCGGGVVGWLSKAINTGAYQECLQAVDNARGPLMQANLQLVEIGNRIQDLNADYSELMQYAPSVDDWQKLCASKIQLDLRHRELKDANTKLAERALEKIKNEQTLQDKADNEYNRFEQMLQLFLDALRALLEMLRSVFESFLKGLTKISAFVADHPWIFWVGGGVVGLGILAFILRPYVTMLRATIS